MQFEGWHSKLPVETVLRTLQVLVPQVEALCAEKGVTDEVEILQFLQHGTLVGLLPVPHPIVVRKYHPSAGPMLWLISYIWGIIYLRYVAVGSPFCVRSPFSETPCVSLEGLFMGSTIDGVICLPPAFGTVFASHCMFLGFVFA